MALASVVCVWEIKRMTRSLQSRGMLILAILLIIQVPTVNSCLRPQVVFVQRAWISFDPSHLSFQRVFKNIP